MLILVIIVSKTVPWNYNKSGIIARCGGIRFVSTALLLLLLVVVGRSNSAIILIANTE